ncbi:putative signaling protein [Polaromonas vacuolata]|uniref:Putative signaling protein n=1 Tax=Polaromonas vacuolata TaxID=37448 RepID=A0A6H2H6B1_9BURK|nr:EAL domain-containing protein [Polaromonas vacuolata]QJC55343.1 putative signaling protein [Polaromonas vacuolata]
MTLGKKIALLFSRKSNPSGLICLWKAAEMRSAIKSISRQISAVILNWPVAWIILFISLLLTFLVWRSAQEDLARLQQVQLESRVSKVSDAVLRRVQAYEQVLRGGVGLLAASDVVTRSEFQDYIASLNVKEHYPAIQGIGYAVHIPAADLELHKRKMRAEGFPDYDIYPTGERDQYTSIIYLEPFNLRNQRAFGFDMFSEPKRRAAMEVARDTGNTAVSTKVTLVQESGEKMQASILMYLPFYKNGKPRATLEERRSNLQGYVYSPFRLDKLMGGILNEAQTGVKADINMEVYEDSQYSAENLLYDDNGIPDMRNAPRSDSLALTQSITVFGHTWSLYFTTRPAFHAAFDQNKPLRFLGFGTIFSVLLSALMWLFTKQRRRALVQASYMQEEIVERKKAEEELRLAALMYQHSSEAMSVADSTGAIVSINPAYTKVTGYTLEDAVGRNCSLHKANNHDRKFFRAMWDEINATGHWQGEIWNWRKNGEAYLEWTTVNTIYLDDGSVHRYVAQTSDITQKKASEKLIWQQANYDLLTGLPNRHMFHDRLERAIKKSRRSGFPMALLLLDLDRFKEVNDALGHAQGDVLLVEAARRIATCVRESDTVARLGGDEFTVILSELVDINSAEHIAQNIIKQLAAPFELLQDVVFVQASVGITLYPDDSLDVETLIKNADQAMYVAKNLGGNRFSRFTQDLQEAAETRLRMMRDLRNALAANQLEVYYQPIVEIATGKIYKAEALLRWKHPELGMVSPMQFIPLAEESRLIHDINDWVFHEATRELASWRKQLVPEFQISVNVSPVELRQNREKVGAHWIRHLQALGLPGKSLAIEITESILLNAESNVTDKLHLFRDAGIEVSIDDFGTGYSSLSYLKKFDIDYLKVDQSFVHNLVDGTDDKVLCEAIIVMAHKLGLKVIAEGVETQAQLDLLTAYGCDYAQGWLYSKAVTAPDFFALLLKNVKL